MSHIYRKTRIFFLLTLTSLVFGCGGGGGGSPVDNRDLDDNDGNETSAIATFGDPNLQACFDQLVTDNGWRTAEDVTAIHCSNKGIQSVNGLDQFSNLVEIDFSHNLIQSFSVPDGLSLQTVNLTGNSGIKCTELDTLENNPALSIQNLLRPDCQLTFVGAEQVDTAFSASAERAIDFVTDGRFSNLGVTHTLTRTSADTDHPWWEGQLQESSFISRVVVHNRIDGNIDIAQRLNGFYILISKDNILDIGQQVTDITTFQNDPQVFVSRPLPVVSRDPIEWHMPTDFEGQYVYLIGPNAHALGSTYDRALHIAEVEVFTQITADQQLVFSRAEQKHTNVSWINGDAEKAIDGITNGVYDNGSVTHTNGQRDNTWWEGELLAESSIRQILIHNRTDSESDRLVGAYLIISKTNLLDQGDQPESFAEYKAQSELVVSEPITSVAQTPITWDVPESTQGKYIYIFNPNYPLHVAEVEAFGIDE